MSVESSVVTTWEDEAPQEVPVVRIRPPRGWVAIDLAEIWRYRDLLLSLANRDIKLRYRQTALGVAWVALQPLLAAGIFAMVFGRVAKLPSDGVPYFLFSLAGLLGWNLFSGAVTRSSACLLGNSHLISKVYFPRMILPLSTLLPILLDFGVALGALAVLLPFHRLAPSWGMVTLPVWIALLLLLGAGIGLIAAALSVTYRDIQYVLPVMMQFVLYASPVGYASSAVPASLRPLYALNPLTGLLDAVRWSTLGVGSLSPGALCYGALMALGCFLLGATVFRSMERRFADVL